jgi:putative glycosyltransferase (TIGR04348 family)
MNPKHSVVIVSPALQDANNGNWQTARRWAQMLMPRYRTHITKQISASDALSFDVLIALHARRSSEAVATWHAARGPQGLILALTGTDLYRDIDTDESAQRSLALAQQLIVLQELGAQRLPAQYHSKTHTIFQSTSSLKPLAKTPGRLGALMVGHLREEKMPQTLFEAVPLLAHEKHLKIRHIGSSLDEHLLALATKTAANYSIFTAAGSLNHRATRRAIQRAHVLVHTSRMEGGAHVVMEAACSGTPVLASHIDGNIGMLGSQYDGYFPLGDAPALAALLRRCKNDSAYLDHLNRQCAQRAPLFSPKAEQQSLLSLVDQVLHHP